MQYLIRLKKVSVGKLFCLFVAIVFSSGSLADEKKARVQLQQLKKTITELQKSLSSSKGEHSKVRQQLRDSEVAIGKLTKEIRTINYSIKQHQQKLSALKSEQSSLELARSTQEVQIGKQIRAAYQMGRQEYIKLLLNQEDPHQVARTVRYYDYFNQSRIKRIELYKKTLADIAQVSVSINDETNQLLAQQASVKERSNKLKMSNSERKRILQQLSATIKTKDEKLRKLHVDQQHLEKILAAVEMAITDLPTPKNVGPFVKSKGKLPWPVKGKVAHQFGSSQSQGQLRRNGMVIQAKLGAPVNAIHHGRIVFADWLRSFGLLLIVDHGGNYMSLYAHNQSLLREAGDWVYAGDTIATVGNSGGQEFSGLYFEIRYKGQPKNPTTWCIARK